MSNANANNHISGISINNTQKTDAIADVTITIINIAMVVTRDCIAWNLTNLLSFSNSSINIDAIIVPRYTKMPTIFPFTTPGSTFTAGAVVGVDTADVTCVSDVEGVVVLPSFFSELIFSSILFFTS